MSPRPSVEVVFTRVPLDRLRELLELVRPLQTSAGVRVTYRLERAEEQ